MMINDFDCAIIGGICHFKGTYQPIGDWNGEKRTAPGIFADRSDEAHDPVRPGEGNELAARVMKHKLPGIRKSDTANLRGRFAGGRWFYGRAENFVSEKTV